MKSYNSVRNGRGSPEGGGCARLRRGRFGSCTFKMQFKTLYCATMNI